jgi:hypothetical protein
MDGEQRFQGPPDVVRLVLGGFEEALRLRTAYAELRGAGLRDEQLCVFRLLGRRMAEIGEPALPHERRIDGLRLAISSEMLFDRVRLAEAEPYGQGAPWMPARQAQALWLHIREGRPALLAGALSSDEQVACSRVQLRHRPRFLHTFNFSRS